MKRFFGVVLLGALLNLSALGAPQDPATPEQTLQCLNPQLNGVDYPDSYQTCTNVLVPYVCGQWALTPNGFTAPPYSRYMLLWNSYCKDTYRQAPPPG